MGMAVILFNGPWPFDQIFNPPLTNRRFKMKFKKIGPGVSEDKLFKGVDGRRTEGRRTATDHYSSSWALGSG